MRTRWGIACSLGALLAACGDSGGGTGDQEDRDFELPETYTFDRVPVGVRVVDTIEITNASSAPIILESIETDDALTGDGYAFSIESSLPLTIGLGTPTRLEVAFEASEVGTRVETVLGLRFDLDRSADVTVNALPVNLEDALVLQPEQLDFEEVLVGRPKELTLTVTNLLDRSLDVFVQASGGEAQIDALTGTGDFSVGRLIDDQNRLSGGNPLLGRDSIDVDVTYGPSLDAITSDQARWRVGLCEGLSPECTYDVLMLGRPLLTPVECRLQGSDEPLEVLDLGNLNPPETGTATVTCEALSNVRISAIESPLEIATGVRVRDDIDVPPVDLGRGTEFNFFITFDPTALIPGEDLDGETLDILLRDPSNNTDLPTSSFGIEAGHGRPVLTIQPEQLDFQSVRFNTLKRERIQITNTGATEFSGRMRIEPEAGTEDGAFFSPSEDVTFVIASGASREVEMFFRAPLTAGDKPARAVFETTEFSDPRNPDFSFDFPMTAESQNLPLCELRLSSIDLVFGQSEPLTENRAYLSITNDESANCLVNGIKLLDDTDDAFYLVDPPDEVAIPRNESLILEVAFVPDRPLEAADLSFGGTVEFYASTEEDSMFEIPLSGTQSKPGAFVMRAPNVVDLRAGEPECTFYSKEASIINDTDSTITVTDVRLRGNDLTGFVLELSSEPPFQISRRGGREVFTVKSRPSALDTATFSARVEIMLQGEPEPLIIPLLASAAVGSRVEESFVQAGRSQTDVIISTPWHQDMPDQLLVNLMQEIAPTWQDFSAPLKSEGIDYHIGFINSRDDSFTCGNDLSALPRQDNHGGGCGLLANGPVPAVGGSHDDKWRVINGDESPLTEQAVFQGMIQRQVSGAGAFEAAIDAMWAALTPLPVSDWNSEIHRRDSHLHLVFINNIDDTSDFQDVSVYVDAFRYARGHPRRFDTTASALVGPVDGCRIDSFGEVFHGFRFERLVERLGGGTLHSVCEEAFPEQMRRIGSESLGLRRSFPLDRAADETSIRLFADGASVPSQDGETTNWSYDGDTRMLTLTSTETLARPGVEITVDYLPACDP